MTKTQEWLQANSDLAIELLSTLCRQPSISATGEGIDKMGPLLVDVLREQGLESSLVPTRGNPLVVAREPGTSAGKTLLFYNHYDVQPVGPESLWKTPPFEPTVIGDRLYARGSTDNKGNIVSRILALNALRKTGQKLPINVKWVVEGEEESGSPNLLEALKANRELLQCDWCIWEDTFREDQETLVISLGSKAMCFVELEARVAEVDIHSGFAPAFESAAWRLVHALASLHDPQTGRVLIPGYYDSIISLTPGEQALLDKLPPLRSEVTDSRRLGPALTSASAAKALIVNPTCNISGIGGGYMGAGSKNAVLSRAGAKIDMRLVPGQDAATVAGLLRQHLDASGFVDIEITHVRTDGKPSRYSPDNALVRALAQEADGLFERGVAIEPGGAGCTPVWVVREGLGCEATANVGAGVVGSNTHAPNENIRIPEILRMAEVYARAILRLGDPSL